MENDLGFQIDRHKLKFLRKAACQLTDRFLRPLIAAWILCALPYSIYAYEVIENIHGGTIRGTVKWKDETLPESYIHTVVKNPDFCGKTFRDDALMVNTENRGMQNAMVYLSDIEKGRAAEGSYVNIIKGCRFSPRVMGVVKGRLIGFRHDDFITHNIHLFRLDNNATVLNFGLPIHRWQQTITRMHRQSGFLKMQCDIHAHMNGLILSLDHDYFAITDVDGAFEIKDIPPGTYHLVVIQGGYTIQNLENRHEKGFRPIFEKPHRLTEVVEVKKDETTERHFEFDLNH